MASGQDLIVAQTCAGTAPCEACGTEMRWVKAHYECPRCHWIKPCCEPDLA